jgi:alpha-L-rhamnosidase
MQTFAEVMERPEEAAQYGDLAESLAEKIRERFWAQAVTEKINRQTLFATLLYHDIIPEADLPAAKDSLLRAVKNGPASHFNTGIFGTKYVLETLSEFVSPDSVFAIVNSTTYPGWGHMIDRGATTIWETWKESDNTFSNNHPMFGTVTEWYYRWLAGIRPQAAYPGFQRFTLAPSPPSGLDAVDCTYHSPLGAIVSNWKKTEETYLFDFTIPAGSTAEVQLPFSNGETIPLIESPQDIPALESGRFELTKGTYQIKLSRK